MCPSLTGLEALAKGFMKTVGHSAKWTSQDLCVGEEAPAWLVLKAAGEMN